jgi:GT2 family glycosyltransferase/glycosyltransferase involved in cell wall biosynthesis
MSRSRNARHSDGIVDNTSTKNLRILLDQDWYLERYPDVTASGMDPVQHYLQFGAEEGRDPNRYFDGAWYREHYTDVARSGLHSLLHYMQHGAKELRNPHPRFDAAWYTEQHLEAATNPLVYHMLFGHQRGWPTERPVHIADYLPSDDKPPACPPNLVVDIVIPVYRGMAETRRCLESVLADPDRPAGRVIVIDDASPEPRLSAWLDVLKQSGRILLIRNKTNQGFVASVNAGMNAAGGHDVALLNSDTEVPRGWLARLAGHAYAMPQVASVSPFSNNATICSYPAIAGGPAPFGLTVDALDEACRTANGGRRVEVPTTVGFCMYIRRAALRDVGPFDAEAFGRGYGEENDFCLRATKRGWRHLLACDVFVYHAGKISFRADATAQHDNAQAVLARRWPDYQRIVERHVRHDEAGPARFAITAQLFRQSNRPVILLVSHDLGGGVRRHINDLVARTSGSAPGGGGGRADAPSSNPTRKVSEARTGQAAAPSPNARRAHDQAHFLLLEFTPRGTEISVPELPGHSPAILPSERIDDIVTLLASAGVTRVHIHHLLGMDVDLRQLIHRLAVPFDLTVHDYFALCPQVNLLPWLNAHYCNEPGPAGCNACIASRPSHGARDITSWRRQHAWLFLEAERVLCPSEDVRARLARHSCASRAVVVPHEPVTAGPWPLARPRLARGEKLRVALIGVLAQQKGLATVEALVEAADPSLFSFHLIGYPEQDLPPSLRRRLKVSGEYPEAELPALLAKTNPHVAWFPAQWPETYSFTMSAAIEAGLPIVASRIGAFPERLEGRPHTWLVDPAAPTKDWLDTFGAVREALSNRTKPASVARPAAPDFYANEYLRPPANAPLPLAGEVGAQSAPGEGPAPRSPIDLRRPGRTSVVLIPERFGTGPLTPCAYIRLLQPFDHLAADAGLDIVLADAAQAVRYRPDVIVTQRHAVDSLAAAEALHRHCRDHDIALLYDLDDDLLDIPREHADANELRPRARIVELMLRAASAVWVSTPRLKERLARMRVGAAIVPNALDERLWADPPPIRPTRQGPVRILFMGTATHDADFALVEPALARLHEAFPGRVQFEMIGVSNRRDLAEWVHRVPLAVSGNLSYPGFVNWMAQQPAWDIGIAPLADTPFNRGKSAIKAMDYAALGLAVAASDVAAYRDTVADGATGLLVASTEAAWFDALSRLVRDPALRLGLARGARTAFAERWTLAAQAELRRAAWREVVATKPAQPQRTPGVHRNDGNRNRKAGNSEAAVTNVPVRLPRAAAAPARAPGLRPASGRARTTAAPAS